jgi:hypothetical protein
MKRILLFTTVLFFYTFTSAQLTVKSSQTKYENIGTIRLSYASMGISVTNGDTAVYIQSRSTNQFDSPYLFCLGVNPKSALSTAIDLVKLFDSMEANAAISVEDALGRGYTIVRKNVLGAPAFYFQGDGYAGTFNLTPKEGTKCINIIKEHFKLNV